MEYTVRIEGMTCGHCAAAVQAALEGVAGVTGVTVDLPAGRARVVGANDIPAPTLAAAVEDAGFDVVGVD